MTTVQPLAPPSSMPERFVSADEAARFLSVKRRYLLELARRGIGGAYPLGTGAQRRTWVFRLSELAGAVAGQTPIHSGPTCAILHPGSPR